MAWYFFLVFNVTPLYGYASLSTHLLKGLLVAYKFWQLWTITNIHVHVCANISYYVNTKACNYWIIWKRLFSFIIRCYVVLQSGSTILHCHQQWRREFLLLLSAFGGSVLNFRHSDRCMRYPLFALTCNSLMVVWCWVSFCEFICHLFIFFGNVSVYIFCPF